MSAERDDYRARLDSEGGAGGRERVVAETNTLLAAHRVRMAAAEAQLARVVAERDKGALVWTRARVHRSFDAFRCAALARIAELEPLIPQSPTSEARKVRKALASSSSSFVGLTDSCFFFQFQEAVAHHKSGSHRYGATTVLSSRVSNATVAAELDELRAQLAVERARQDQLRADVGAAEERAREMR